MISTRATRTATAALAMTGAVLAAPTAAWAAMPTRAVSATAVAAAAATSHPLLREGSAGAAVREWQTVMTYVLGTNSVAIDGIFGPRTTAATRTVQTMFHLSADGVVGPRTWSATAAVHAPVDPTAVDGTVAGVGHLELGDRGARVVQWQRLLDLDPRSSTSTAADGIFGPATLAATRAFQSRYRLVADGIVGPSTRATMQQVRDDV